MSRRSERNQQGVIDSRVVLPNMEDTEIVDEAFRRKAVTSIVSHTFTGSLSTMQEKSRKDGTPGVVELVLGRMSEHADMQEELRKEAIRKIFGSKHRFHGQDTVQDTVSEEHILKPVTLLQGKIVNIHSDFPFALELVVDKMDGDFWTHDGVKGQFGQNPLRIIAKREKNTRPQVVVHQTPFTKSSFLKNYPWINAKNIRDHKTGYMAVVQEYDFDTKTEYISQYIFKHKKHPFADPKFISMAAAESKGVWQVQDNGDVHVDNIEDAEYMFDRFGRDMGALRQYDFNDYRVFIRRAHGVGGNINEPLPWDDFLSEEIMEPVQKHGEPDASFKKREKDYNIKKYALLDKPFSIQVDIEWKYAYQESMACPDGSCDGKLDDAHHCETCYIEDETDDYE